MPAEIAKRDDVRSFRRLSQHYQRTARPLRVAAAARPLTSEALDDNQLFNMDAVR